MSDHKPYDHQKIERAWHKRWSENTFSDQNLINAKKPFYNLMMFPYPSGEGLHVGNMYAFTGADIYGRFKSLLGYDVFEPIGLDGFGIHSENFALKKNAHPAKLAKVTQKNFYDQLSQIGNHFAWSHRLETYDPDYYRWTQWLFTELYKAGLAYRGEALVNWCPSCKTVLADEQVIDGDCERCGTHATRKKMSSWYFKITDYADRLLDGLNHIDWPVKIKKAQEQWIGKKAGINITYQIKETNKTITCFTTRPDTNFGATFIVLAPEHPLVKSIISKEIKVDPDKLKKIELYVKVSLSKTEQARKIEEKKKTGVETGLFALNKLNGTEIPIYITDFVLMGVGTGAVIGVPGHDKRDFEFAKAFNLPIKRVVMAADGNTSEITHIEQVQEEEGVMINSGFLDGLNIHTATEKIMDYIESKGWGKRTYSYHLRDWLISRQRYWGPPIPMVHCDKCSWQPVHVKDLPVLLPDIEDYKPKGDGSSPLSNAPESWRITTCPKCGGEAERELDIIDNFVDSSWYFLAYPNLHTQEWQNGPTPFNTKIMAKWLPVNAYIGGAEHAVLHLLYSRFVTMALKDLGHINFEEPFPFLYGHGLIIKDGAKMSKSKGNIVNPDTYIERYGADTLRTYLMFLGPYDQGGDFRDSGIAGMYRFVNRLWQLFNSPVSSDNSESVIMHQTIKKVTEDLENFRYNTAIATIMEYVNHLRHQSAISHKQLAILCQLVAPFMPHLAEEVWSNVLNQEGSVHTSTWPKHDANLAQDQEVVIAIQVNGKLRGTISVATNEANDEEKLVKEAKANQKVSQYLADIKYQTIFIPGKIINFVEKKLDS